MEERKSISKNVVATISALVLAATVTGGGIAWFTMQNRPQAIAPNTVNPSNPATIDPAQVQTPTATPIPTPPSSVDTPTVPDQTPTAGIKTTKSTTPSFAKNTDTVKIWRLDDDGKKTFLVSQDRPNPDTSSTASSPDARVKSSLSTLIASAGKPEGKLTSTIPVGTKLLSAKVMADGIHVDLSKEFTQGYGATSMIGRLGQVVYTATTQNPTAPVWITVEGKKLEVLGDVGVEVRQPVTRESYNRDFPITPSTTNP
ncbi:GerMN domain-containing protein [Chamaesiphon minutus]|uniref:Sporulation/spore germination protein n=1 Tax=Chamaesiphon minutus (strain ATCC 27169 / PCC 6605) TaxID=1173020 RepID=K9ULN2_CHAP6|nr:GerMN domain-containing protein [Chamaesiphon minutus]AFY95326.1 sporulation/spore germination protein [Chamaesiphon minutus PCC 6605]